VSDNVLDGVRKGWEARDQAQWVINNLEHEQMGALLELAADALDLLRAVRHDITDARVEPLIARLEAIS
jgi:hypothetical protein